jgi:hypothetical protein
MLNDETKNKIINLKNRQKKLELIGLTYWICNMNYEFKITIKK